VRRLARLNESRLRLADSKTAAAAFFVVVLMGQLLAGVWIGSSAVAFAGVLVYSTVWCVLLGILTSIVIGGLGS